MGAQKLISVINMKTQYARGSGTKKTGQALTKNLSLSRILKSQLFSPIKVCQLISWNLEFNYGL